VVSLHEPDRVLIDWLGELSREVGQLDRVLAVRSATEEPFGQPLCDRIRLICGELAEVRAALEPVGTALADATRWSRPGESPVPRSGDPASHFFRIPGYADVPVTQADWDAIERLLSSVPQTGEAA